MFDKAKELIHVLNDNYLIQVDFVKTEDKPNVNAFITLDKKYIIYNEDKSIDFTDDSKIASCFSFLLGYLIVKKLESKRKETPNLRFSLVSAGDANFMDAIFNNTKPI